MLRKAARSGVGYDSVRFCGAGNVYADLKSKTTRYWKDVGLGVTLPTLGTKVAVHSIHPCSTAKIRNKTFLNSYFARYFPVYVVSFSYHILFQVVFRVVTFPANSFDLTRAVIVHLAAPSVRRWSLFRSYCRLWRAARVLPGGGKGL